MTKLIAKWSVLNTHGSVLLVVRLPRTTRIYIALLNRDYTLHTFPMEEVEIVTKIFRTSII